MRRLAKPAAGLVFLGILALIWAQDSPPADANRLGMPAPTARMTAAYVRDTGRMAYLWAWPMVNLHNRALALRNVAEPGLIGGIFPAAPPNHLAMLQDYIRPEERTVACPNHDVLYGAGVLHLDREPVVLQAPDFGSRFWVYQVVDQRTNSFARLGKMYHTKEGFYLLAGPDWRGTPPRGITRVIRSSTNLGFVIPRVFFKDTPEDRREVRRLINQIAMYPLSEFDGSMQTKDWSALPSFPAAAAAAGGGEIPWVDPAAFFDQLPEVLDEVPPAHGERAIYSMVRSVLDAAAKDPALMTVLKQAAADADREVVAPLLEFRNFGISLPHNWTTIHNGAAFGADYFTRTAVARSNIFINAPNETRYFYLDLDSEGARLNGSKPYTITFVKSGTPPVHGFWSLTMYDEQHFFSPNRLNRYSLGTNSKALRYGADGSLTLYVQSQAPSQDKMSNWLPAPKGDFSLYLRAYWPQSAILNGNWTPPAVVAANARK